MQSLRRHRFLPAKGRNLNSTGGLITAQRWAGSFRNGGRHHSGTVGGIISEHWAPSARNRHLYRYRKYQKSRAEERLDKVVRLADQLGLPRAALTGGDRPLPSLPPAAAAMAAVQRTPFPEFADAPRFATALSAKLAISVQISRPLGSLPDVDRAFIDALLAETLDRDIITIRVRDHFKNAGRRS